MAKAQWENIDINKLPKELKAAFDAYKKAQHDFEELAVAAGIKAGKIDGQTTTFAFGYRFGLSRAIVPVKAGGGSGEW